jgi:hypothetical protein
LILITYQSYFKIIAAYLLADFVPTTVFALGAVTFIVKRRDKAALEALEIIDANDS